MSESVAVEAEKVSLGSRVPAGGTRDADEILDLFLGWVAEVGFELYPAQEEALLEVMAGRHVILSTPTGSGKSLVALGMHFKGLCEDRRSFYTSPIKALASEKFFALCDDLGPENVGMLTGDASINPDALVICCTAEVLSNMALRRGEELDAPYVVMDEFHYYSDPERGVAWQVPLITLPHTRFLLMSATLGNTAAIAERLEKDTGVGVALVTGSERPVPLDFEYRETPLHETVEYLVDAGKAPVYIVCFTQRECAELAQSLTSMKVAGRDERQRIWDAIGDFRFDTAYGKEMRRFLNFGIGVHHAGLLPKYRLLVEQLSQKGLLKVICGTDTLGVGVNIPIRTVLFSRLSKYDGTKNTLLSVRDFKQIAGRAGRKGFDEQGSVVCQAPEHIIENQRLEAKSGSKKARKKPPPRGFVPWNKEIFEQLVERPPETLESRFRVTHGMILDLLQRDAELDDPNQRNFHSLRRLIAKSHDTEAASAYHIRDAAVMARSLYRAGILQMRRDVETDYLWVVVNEDLQWDFSLYQALSIYLVETLNLLDPQDPDYPLTLLSLVESVLEDPRLILRRQVDKLRDELFARLKAEGVDYEERMEKLQEVTYPKPCAELIYRTFDQFREEHPWVGGENIRPKGIGREMFEGFLGFNDFVRRYGIQRSEGLLLRYVSQLYKTLDQTVPAAAKTEEVYDIQAFFRAILERTDTSLLEEWESMVHPELRLNAEERAAQHDAQQAMELIHHPRLFAARVRAELHHLARALAEGDWEDATFCVRDDPDDPAGPWTAERFEEALAPFLEEYGEIVFTPEARQSQWTRVEPVGDRLWNVTQVLLDPEGDNLWHLEGVIDLSAGHIPEGPLVYLRRVGV